MDFISTLNSGLLLDSLSESFIIIDLNGVIQYNNTACEELFGYAENELVNQKINILMHQQDSKHHDSFLNHYNTSSPSKVIGSASERPLTGKKKDQSIFPVDIRITSFKQGNENYVIGVIRDLTEIISTNNRLNHVLTSIDTVLYTLELNNDQLKTLWTSPNILEQTGYSIDEALSQGWWINHLHPEDKQQAMNNFDLFLQSGELEQEYRFKTKDRGYIWIQDKLKLIRNSDPQIIHGSWNNISERKTLLSSLINSEDRLAKSQSFANIGTWDWNIQTGELYWSERIAPLFGYPDGQLDSTYDNFVNALHPDDKDMVLNAIINCIENNTEYDIEHRIIWPDGTVRWIHEKGDVVRNENEQPFHMLGVVTDINERKTLQIQQQQHQQLLNTLHESLSHFTLKADYRKSSDILLQGLLSISKSEYGFIGEVLYRENNAPYLKTYAITDISWNAESHQLFDSWKEKGFEFTNLDTLFGHVMTSGDSVISNSPDTDPRAKGLPEGHPPMSSFIGVPVYYGKTLIGMYGLANRQQGYDQELIDSLKLFADTYASIIQAKRSLDQEKQIRRDLIEAKEAAESSNRSKSSFLSNMSHELRTPLNAIFGFSQLLNLEDDLSTEAKENVTDIIHAGKHLLDLINDVLDLAKIEAGKTEVVLEAISVNELFSVCETLTATLAEKFEVNVNFIHNVDTDNYIHADFTKVKQVLINLISNAIKYNKHNGNVTVNCSQIKDRNEMKISIIDNGQGIADSDIGHLFEPFNRLGAENNTSIEGTGIGLVITKKLLKLMHGSIHVSSTPGQGSEFSFTLPAADKQESFTIQTAASEVASSTQNNGKKVYYIEDNIVNLRMVKQLINKWTEFEFIGSPDPILGIEEIKRYSPDVILLDINLPKMNGFEVYQYLKNNNICPGVPIFAITANAMEADVDKIKLAGFDQYISKPIDIEDLLEKINLAMK